VSSYINYKSTHKLLVKVTLLPISFARQALYCKEGEKVISLMQTVYIVRGETGHRRAVMQTERVVLVGLCFTYWCVVCFPSLTRALLLLHYFVDVLLAIMSRYFLLLSLSLSFSLSSISLTHLHLP
jgi:hypothetical protein